jgi:ferredoxin
MSVFPIIGVLLLILLPILLLTVPLRMRRPPADSTPSGRIDERDTMFSRNELRPGSDTFADYYERRPDFLETDETIRNKPGLLSTAAKQTDPLTSMSAGATFGAVSILRDMVDGEPATEKISLKPDDAARYVKGWCNYLGAHSVGVTTLEPYHLYSVLGRGDRYGSEDVTNHRYLVALTVEMDHAAVQRSPRGPIVMESARQYLSSGAIAVQLAEFFRRAGYSARAHIDGSYHVVCPLAARDAGLGEIGRMGILMTPDLGPRVRIAVVTTDMPLSIDARTYDPTVIDFCERCEKCADVCPSGAIERGVRTEHSGSIRWKISQERCYSYWKVAGTDCGRCMAVCPYAHPDTASHRLVRRLIRRNFLFRRLAVIGDDILYGKRPKPAPLAPWQKIRPDE